MIINKKLDHIEYQFKQAYYAIVDIDGVVSSDKLKRQLKIRLNQYNSSTNIFAHFDALIEESKNGTRLVNGKRVAPNTWRNYLTTRNHLYNFDPSLTFKDINLDFYRRFLNYFHRKGSSDNTIGTHIKNLKTLMNETLDVHHNSAFKQKEFKTPDELTTKVALSQWELDEMMSLDLSDNPRLERVRDVFIVGCSTALRYSDWFNINKFNIVTDRGRKYLRIGSTFKTGVGVLIPISKTLLSILEKYNYRLRPISNQKFNNYIKDVFKMIESANDQVEIVHTVAGKLRVDVFEKWTLISSHTARRTAATNMYKANIDTIAIMKITGHKREANFMKYIRVSEMESAQKIANNPFFDN